MVNQQLEHGAPTLDNLYLDMNGIIHNCTHANEGENVIKSGKDEDEMMLKIFAYIDSLFQMIKPRKAFFMAIDGSAPRAKMNQQRARRFRSAKDRLEAEAQARERGEEVPDDPFDSNCITPGTPFMQKLTRHLQFFVRKKMAEDPAWQRPQVILSGPDIPGEGEHKIMEYIRWAKQQPDYKPNIRHCMYGLDADLIMLALVTHEPHFCLLREVVSYSGGNRGQPDREVIKNPTAQNFVLLHLGMLREYLDCEFKNMGLSFGYDLERIVDDFILLCMLVGNDFLPTLPTLDINEGGLNNLFDSYRALLPSLGGYLHDSGTLHLGRFEAVMKNIAELEAEVLEERAKVTEMFDQKRSKDRNRRGGGGGGYGSGGGGGGAGVAGGLAGLAASASGAAGPQEKGPTMMSRVARSYFLTGDKRVGVLSWKERYYSLKLEASGAAERRAVSRSYIEGVMWVLEYYYRGVVSWVWYYPYHYAPMASELSNLPEFSDINFVRGSPFLPFQQLLGVLPTASAKLLPPVYRTLMMAEDSPLKAPLDLYPEDFPLDQEGKRQNWEAVILIPFMDEKTLLDAEKTLDKSQLTPDDLDRNKVGSVLTYWFDDDSRETSYCESTLPDHLRSVAVSKSRALPTPPPPPLPDGVPGFVPKLVNGTKSGALSPVGFPSLRTLKVLGRLATIGVNVFNMPSKRDSLVLSLTPVESGSVTCKQVAPMVLGERCHVRWPLLQEATVCAVSDATGEIRTSGFKPYSNFDLQDWYKKRKDFETRMFSKQGLEVGNAPILVHVRVCEGMVRRGDGAIEKRFAKDEMCVPLQAVLRRNPRPDPRFKEKAAPKDNSAAKALMGKRVMFMGRAYYGCLASVVSMTASKMDAAGGGSEGQGTLRIMLEPPPMTEGAVAQAAKRLLQNVQTQYFASYQMARQVGVGNRTLGLITGGCTVEADDGTAFDVGLSLKSFSHRLVVPDYSSWDEQSDGFVFSSRAVSLLKSYKQNFPWLFQGLDSDPGKRRWKAADLLPGVEPQIALQELTRLKKWVKKQPASRLPLVSAESQVASEDAIRAFQSAAPLSGNTISHAPVEMDHVKPGLLLHARDVEDPALLSAGGGAFDVGDRVVCLGGFPGAPPFGMRGTCVGSHPDAAVEILFDAEFVGGSDLHGRAHPGSRTGAILPGESLLNVSKAQALEAGNGAAPAPAASKSQALNAWDRKAGELYPQGARDTGGSAPPQKRKKNKKGKPASDAVEAAHTAANSALSGRGPPSGALPVAPVDAGAGQKLMAMLMKGGGNGGAGAAVNRPSNVETSGKAAGQALLGMISSAGTGGGAEVPSQAMSLGELEGKLKANKMEEPAPAGDTKPQGDSGSPSGNERAFWEMLKGAGPAP